MNTANVSRARTMALPRSLRTAQDAIHLPEVQEMLRRLSEYKLGIFMPHRHDDQTGEFESLPDDVMQVESGLAVSFQETAAIAQQSDRYMPVAWRWRSGASAVSSVCEMVGDENPGSRDRGGKHKMIVR